ncbi:MAG: succinyldiaminopimelate transaminase, partial [bacterium]|nr:succinyldiaminopimelate transaminase [bacterium]
DLSVGTPVDPTPQLIQDALSAAADAPGYPTTVGRDDLRAACSAWIQRILGASVAPTAILPAIGSKEIVASLPRLLNVPLGSRVVVPRIAYPTYAVGALLAGAEPIATDEPEDVEGASLVWLNSPGNPTGAVLPASRMAEIVEWARATGVVVASDECYIELGWEAQPSSILHPDVCGGSHDSVLAVHSLSKRSNLAGYRFGFVAGDSSLVSDLLAVRKHLGMMVPAPVQAAAIAAWNDDAHVAAQRTRYSRRRDVLRSAVEAAGFRVDHGEAGLYLWITRDEPCWLTVAWFADRGILVTPGDFYGVAGERHVRVALTGTDANIDAVPGRLTGA